jgi:glycosyltransferase involved in cell wall biosynthesis
VPAFKLFTGLHAVDNARFIDAEKTVPLKAAEPRKNLGIDRQLVIIFVGKFAEVKRPLDLLIAYADLPAHLLRTTKIVCVGDGPLRQIIRRHAERLGLDSVLFLPFQNQSMLPAVYLMADVLVLPSLSETWGLVVNEAMNLGCPAIVTERVGCAYDLVVPRQTGWVFPPGNTRALKQCVEEALSDPERLHQIGENARRHVLQFSHDGITASLQQTLQYASQG